MEEQERKNAQTQALPSTRDLDTNEVFFGQEGIPASEELLIEWNGPNRLYKPRTREYFTTIAVITVLVCILAFFAGQTYAIPMILSVAFLSYVFAAVPPANIHYQITTFGIRMGKVLYPWESLGRFWVTERFNTSVLHAEYDGQLFRRISLVLTPEIKEDAIEIASLVLPNEKPTPTFVERAGQWLQEKFPLEHE